MSADQELALCLASDGATFGREIAEYAMAEARTLVLTPAEATARERQLASIGPRAMRAIRTAAQHRHAAGLSRADADAWARDALSGFRAAIEGGRRLVQHGGSRGH